MIAKEWLEDIKERFAKYQTDYNLNGEDVEWLIQQAERVQELENHLNLYDFWYRIAYEQNKRYREALNNIYELAEYDEYNSILEQIVSEVEKALEGTE